MKKDQISKPVEYIEFQNFDKAEIEYTQAVIKYKKWKFIILPNPRGTSTPWFDFEIIVEHELFDGDKIYLSNWKVGSTLYPVEKITSMDQAIVKVRSFINNELQ